MGWEDWIGTTEEFFAEFLIDLFYLQFLVFFLLVSLRVYIITQKLLSIWSGVRHC